MCIGIAIQRWVIELLTNVSLGSLQPTDFLFFFSFIHTIPYNIFELAKSYHVSYLLSLNKGSESFTVIHSDVWGPVKIPFISKARYFVAFIDEGTRMTWVSWLHKKTDVYITFQEFYSMVGTQ